MTRYLPSSLWLARLAIASLLASGLLLTPTAPAQAANDLQAGTPPAPTSSAASGGTDFAGRPLVDVLYTLATLIVQVVVFGAGAIMAANIARGAFSAQLANLVGSPSGMSQAWMNIIASVLTFLLAVLSPMVIGIIAEAVRGFVDVSFTLPRF
jgi:hypothetical protein